MVFFGCQYHRFKMQRCRTVSGVTDNMNKRITDSLHHSMSVFFYRSIFITQRVDTRDTDIKHLIGCNGEVVDALQQLTRLAVQQKTGERSHLIVDVDGFLKRKRQRLRDIALDAIDEVHDTGEPVDLKPMNSFERKVIHDVVREEGLKSRSHGEEPRRYVTIYMKSSADESDVDEGSEE